MDYDDGTKVLKALGEPTRLRILDMLSCGEMCACSMLDSLRISQSTLSHHMKVLMDCGMVKARKAATWMHYSICRETVSELHNFLDAITQPKDNCICAPYPGKCG
jgi:ArsR family transcriptional regulator, arsenate/arsenite/antimonite-responsive transcriptional repressor